MGLVRFRFTLNYGRRGRGGVDGGRRIRLLVSQFITPKSY